MKRHPVIFFSLSHPFFSTKRMTLLFVIADHISLTIINNKKKRKEREITIPRHMLL